MFCVTSLAEQLMEPLIALCCTIIVVNRATNCVQASIVCYICCSKFSIGVTLG